MQEQPGITCEVHFPPKFVLARRGYSDNIWRFHCVEAKKTHRENNYQVYDIVDSDWRRSMTGADWVLDPERVDTNQYIVYKRNPPRTVPLRLPYYYITGVSLVKNRQRYPIIEFTCSNFFPECNKELLIPVSRKEDFRKILANVNNMQWHGPLRPRIVPPPAPLSILMPPIVTNPQPPPPTPALPTRRTSYPSPHEEVEDEGDGYYPSDIEYVESLPIPVRPTPLQIPRPLIREEDFRELPRRPNNLRELVREEQDDVPLAFRVHDEPAPPPAPVPLPLPKHVGDMLLKSAREGTECCPISANPYSECKILTVTSCFHVFQKESLTTWQKDHDTCPVCRTKIVNVVDGVGKK